MEPWTALIWFVAGAAATAAGVLLRDRRARRRAATRAGEEPYPQPFPDLRAAIARLDPYSLRRLEAAAMRAKTASREYVEVEDWVFEIDAAADPSLDEFWGDLGVAPERVRDELTPVVARRGTWEQPAPCLSSALVRLLMEAIRCAEVEFGAAQVCSYHVLLALVLDERLRQRAATLASLRPLSADSLRAWIARRAEKERSAAAEAAKHVTKSGPGTPSPAPPDSSSTSV